MPLSAGILEKKRWKASSPPAEAPIPTIGYAGCGRLRPLSPRGLAAAFAEAFATFRGFCRLGLEALMRAIRNTAVGPARFDCGSAARRRQGWSSRLT